MSITVLTVCKEPCARVWPGLEKATLQGRVFSNAADVQRAWFDSIALVRTTHFFWLDDDDDLPADYLSVLRKCEDRKEPLVYTDELVVTAEGSTVRHGSLYSQRSHLLSPMLVHHLALVCTATARAALSALPRGKYWPEMLLYWEIAKRGVSYLPEVGYHWNKSVSGLHTKPWTTIGQMNSALWCKANP